MTDAQKIFKNLTNPNSNLQTHLLVGYVASKTSDGRGYYFPKKEHKDTLFSLLKEEKINKNLLQLVEHVKFIQQAEHSDGEAVKCKATDMIQLLRAEKLTVNISDSATVTLQPLDSVKAA